MAGILHFCARSLSGGVKKATKNCFKKVSLDLEPSKARTYHRNAARISVNAAYRVTVQKFCLESQSQPSLFVSRRIQTTSVLGSTKDVVVPAFADSVSEGDVKWEKQVGDSVVEDETVCEIETDKTSIQVPSPGKGVIEELYIEDGATVKPGMKLFRIKLEA